MLPNKNTLWITEVDKDDINFIGEKAALKGELAHNGFPIPPGFIITTTAFIGFMKANNLHTQISHLLESIDEKNTNSIKRTAAIIKKKIYESKIPVSVTNDIFTQYKKLKKNFFKNPIVSIQSSMGGKIFEMNPQEVQGEASVIAKVKEIWASLFDTEKLIQYREREISPSQIDITIIVQKRILPEKSGKITTIDPQENDKKKLIVTAIYGEEGIGTDMQDEYHVTKNSLSIIHKNKHQQNIMLVRKGQKIKKQNIKNVLKKEQKITDEEIRKLAFMAKKLERYTYFPQEINWAISEGTIHILGTKQLVTEPTTKRTNSRSLMYDPISTVTKIYAEISKIKPVDNLAKRNISGVIIQGTSIIEKLEIHPSKILLEKRQKEYMKNFMELIEQYCKPFSPRPVIYQLSDCTTEKYRTLNGGKSHEPSEQNPLLGYHGAQRHITNPEVLNLELKTLAKLRNDKEYKNLWIMLPIIRTIEELKKIKSLITQAGIYRSVSNKLWFSLETPANILQLDQFIQAGIDGVAINIDNLSSLFLGIQSSECTEKQIVLNNALLETIEKAIRITNDSNLSTILYNNSKQYPTLLEKAITAGVSGIAAQPDTIERVQTETNQIEKELITII